MPAKPTKPDATTQSPAEYKVAIDAHAEGSHRVATAFAPYAQDTPNMTVAIAAGAILSGTTRTEVAAQSTATITAPSGNPRIDLVVIDKTTGAASVVAGSEAASPSEPALPSGKLPVALVSLSVGMTSIADSNITDVRVGGSGGLSGAALEAIAALTPAANKSIRFTSGSAAELITISDFAKTFLDDPDAAAMKTTLGVTDIGMWTPLPDKKSTASNSATLDITGFDFATYDYQFIFRDLKPATTGQALQMLTGTGAGPTYNTADYSYGILGYDQAGAGQHFQGSDTAQITLSQNMTTLELYKGSMVAMQSSDVFCGELLTSKALGSASPTVTTYKGTVMSFSNPVTAVRFKYASGNISSGTVEVWRRTKQ